MAIKSILKELEEGIWATPQEFTLERNSVQTKVNLLLNFDSKDVLVCLFNEMERSFNIPFLLCAPELWSNFHRGDWEYIFSNVKRPSDFHYLMKDYGNFDDVLFLYRYIGVDALKWLFEFPGISQTDKKTIFKYFKIGVHHLIKDSMDEENFGDGTWADLSYYNSMYKNLVAEGVEPLPKEVTPKMIIQQIDSYIGNLK